MTEINSLKVKRLEIDTIIRQELEAIEERKTLIISVPKIRMLSIGMMKLEKPDFLASSFELEKKVYDLENKIDYINELLTQRESYKINNGAMTNFLPNLKIKNEFVLSYLYQLQNLMEELVVD